jgi:hypothetical protein
MIGENFLAPGRHCGGINQMEPNHVHLLIFLLFSGFWITSLAGTRTYQKDKLYTGENLSKREMLLDSKKDSEIDEYKSMLLEKDQKHHLQMLIKKIPVSRHDALELLVREVLLYQQIFQQQVKVIEDMKANPLEHQELSSHFKEFGFKPWKVYQDAKLTVAWCSIVVRWIEWISRHPDEDNDRFERLFKRLFLPYRTHIIFGEQGFGEHLKEVEDRYSPAYTLLLHKCREVLIKAQDSGHAIWFHDNISHSLLFYSTAYHLLVPFITNENLPIELTGLKEAGQWPHEYEILAEAIYSRITFKSRKVIEPSIKIIADQWILFCKLEPYKIATDLWDRSVDDLAFEKSFIDPLNLKEKRPKVPSSISSNDLSKSTPELPKQPQNAKKGSKAKRKQKKKHHASSAPSLFCGPPGASTSFSFELTDDDEVQFEPYPSTRVESVDDVAVEPTKTSTAIKESAPIPIKRSCESLSNPVNRENELDEASAKADAESPYPSPSDNALSSYSSSPAEIFEVSVEEDVQDSWEELVRLDVERRQKYALERKKKTQADKVIRQKQLERIYNERRSLVRQNLKPTHGSTSRFSSASCSAKTAAIALDSTELCLAFYQSHSLFLANKNICSIKAKRFRWFFDQNVTIKQDSMNFLCILFSLQKGRLTFSNMVKTYWAIAKCFDRSLTVLQVVKNVFFEWSHHFQINGVLISPAGKEVHPEHKSSGFNHTEALALFSSGGFDPRFFIPEY